MCTPCFKTRLRIQVRVNKIQDSLSVCAENAAGTGAIAVQAEGCNAGDNVTVTQEIGAARVAKARAASMSVIGQQHGEAAYDASIDLDQVGVGYKTCSKSAILPRGRIWKAFLKPVAN